MLIDTHCHLSYAGLVDALPEVLARAAAVGVTRFLTVGTHPADHAAALSIAAAQAPVFAALGVHPHHAAEVASDYLAGLEGHLRGSSKILAVGEMGLDYHYDFSPRSVQRAVFCDQLALAQRLGLPVILHIREAHADGLAIVQDFPALRCVVHCFTGTVAEARGWLDRGAYVGLTGIVTYKNAQVLREAARVIPLDRLVLETDAPYLSPEPVRKVKINEPAHLAYTARFLAALRSISEAELAAQTTRNAGALFGSALIAE